MDYAACNVVYVDRTAQEDKVVKRDDATSTPATDFLSTQAESHAPALRSNPLDENLRTLLETFSEVHVCTSGKSCISKLSELNRASIIELIPTLVLIDIPYEDQLHERPSRETRTPSPGSIQYIEGIQVDSGEVEAYGLKLLQWVASEIQYQSLSKLVVPVAVVAIPDQPILPIMSRGRTNSRSDELPTSHPSSRKKRTGPPTPLDEVRTIRYLDIGAVDVLTSPLLRERLPSLAIHAYRAHKDALKEQKAMLEMKRVRKRSWVGLDDQKPYAYLREAMVSGLMDGICKLGGDDEPLIPMRISIPLDRREKVAAAIGTWQFSAHDYTDDELLHAASLMLQHALAMPELEKWRISTENLTGFLVASRSAYNAFVPYHNFRHVVDVLQAIFHFLVQLGRLPPYPALTTSPSEIAPSPVAALIRPFDALTLLITAIGHDVGHPGVNNAFLVTLNAPLAQLYNDRSVLESFHCAAYSQILRRHWPAAFQGIEMRQLMISSILATDMGLHFDYIKRLGWMQEKLHENGGTDGWNGRLIEEQRTLACSLLIKCADISNVARKYDVASQWTMILTDEFARQASMEQDLGIPSALFAVPNREIIELGKSQLGFMNMFAIPLFAGVTDVMPGMSYCVDELQRNKAAWEIKIAEEQERVRHGSDDSAMTDGMFSPRAMSVANPSDASHQKTGNAMLSPDVDLRKALLSKSPFTPTNGALAESETSARHESLPEISTASVPAIDDLNNPSPSEVIPDSNSRRSSNKPSQLQLSFATASAPGFLDHPSRDVHLENGEPVMNGVSIERSLVTDPVIFNSEPTVESKKKEKEDDSSKQRSSDGTEGSVSATSAQDWTSQVTSATTGKMPLSPSTQGTSIMSHDSLEKLNGANQTPTRQSPCGRSENSQLSSRTGDHGSQEGYYSDRLDGDRVEGKDKGVVVMEKVRSLKKKPSRFRMNFWKRSKSAGPPMPVGGDEDIFQS